MVARAAAPGLDPFAQAPRIDIVYKVPPGNTPDSYALQVVGQVLSGGVHDRGTREGGAGALREGAHLALLVVALYDTASWGARTDGRTAGL